MLTTWVTFLPSFLFIFVGAPYVEALRHVRALRSALAAITAAVVGVILNLSVWFAIHTIFSRTSIVALGLVRVEAPVLSSVEPGALVLSIAAAVAMLRYHLSLAWTLLASAAIGLAYVLIASTA